MKFSAVICVYEGEKPQYFQEAIESILKQTLLPNEIVIVEDGKLPECLEKIVKYYENNSLFKVYRLDENKGLGHALNYGIKKCQYDYIAKVDSDDICVKDRFEKQIAYLEENPQTDLLGGQIQEYSNDLRVKRNKRIVPILQKDIVDNCRFRNTMNNPTIILRKKIINEVGEYREDIPYMEDYEMLIRLIKNQAQFHNLSDILVYCRVDGVPKRRGGIKYAKSIYQVQKILLEQKLIGFDIFLINVILRTTVAIVPSYIRNWIYQNFLREK